MGGKSLGHRLEHHALAGRHAPQLAQLIGEERAGVGVREQAGLLQDEPAHLGEVVDRRRVTVRGKPVPRHGIALLGPFAKGEERLVAPGGPAGARDGQHALGRQVRRFEPRRGLGEGAVAATVTAQHGQRDEHLRGEGHPSAVRFVAHTTGQRGEVGERRVEEVGVGQHRSQSRGRRHGGAVHQPDRLVGVDPGRRKIFAASQCGDRLGVGRTGHGEECQPSRVDGREGHGQARVGVAPGGVLGGHHELARAGIEAGGTGKEGRRVPVRAHPQVDQIDPRPRDQVGDQALVLRGA